MAVKRKLSKGNDCTSYCWNPISTVVQPVCRFTFSYEPATWLRRHRKDWPKVSQGRDEVSKAQGRDEVSIKQSYTQLFYNVQIPYVHQWGWTWK